MPSCFKCGGPIREIFGTLYKCQMCGSYNSVREGITVPRSFGVFTSFDRVKAAAIEGVYESTKGQPGKGQTEPDMVEFISRLATALAPIEGYTPEIQVKQLELRKQYVKELNEVFDENGKITFQDWFNKTKTKRSLHRETFSKMIYDALEGLQSEGAREMRSQYEAVLTQSMFG